MHSSFSGEELGTQKGDMGFVSCGAFGCRHPSPAVKCCVERRPGDPPSPTISRRAFGSRLLWSLATGLVVVEGMPTEAQAREKPKQALEIALVPIIRVQESCKDLEDGINEGTYEGSYREMKGIVETIIKGNPLKESIRQASLYVDKRTAQGVVEHGKNAIEYLNSVISYFDPVDLKNKPTVEYLNYATKALAAVSKELRFVLAAMPEYAIATATQTLHGDISND